MSDAAGVYRSDKLIPEMKQHRLQTICRSNVLQLYAAAFGLVRLEGLRIAAIISSGDLTDKEIGRAHV